jgi:hypothetical protein
MMKTGWFSRLSYKQPSAARFRHFAGCVGVATLLLTTVVAVAQTPAPDAPSASVPKGYTVHQAIDLGGRMVNVSGSGAMYDPVCSTRFS